MLSRLRTRPRDERGMVLVLALGVMVALAVTSMAIIEYTSTNSRSSTAGKGDQLAFTLAEAGINNALAVLFGDGNAGSQDILPRCTVSNADPTPTSEESRNRSDYEGGRAVWCGDLKISADEAAWYLTSIGIVDNPTGPTAADLRRTLNARVPLQAKLTKSNSYDAWNYLFATRTGTPGGCDLTFSNNVTIGTQVFTLGNLCLDNGVKINGPKVIAMGTIYVANNGAIGSAGTDNWDTRVEVAVGGAGGSYCKYATNHWHAGSNADGHAFCGDTDRVYSKMPNGESWAMGVTANPEPLEAPVPLWDDWYASAMPGPNRDCTSKSGTVPVWDNNTTRDPNNGSVPTVFDLTPATSSYTCVVGPASEPLGQLSWNHATMTLTVQGTIFIDGSAKVANTAVHKYVGQAVIYLSGTFLLDNGAKLCGATTPANDDPPTWTDCDFGGWNPNTTLLTIVANGDGVLGGAGGQTGSTTNGGGNGIKLSNNVRFQGAVQATNAIQLTNNSKVDGPIIAGAVVVDNNVQPDGFPSLEEVPSGMPGDAPEWAEPTAPEMFSG